MILHSSCLKARAILRTFKITFNLVIPNCTPGCAVSHTKTFKSYSSWLQPYFVSYFKQVWLHVAPKCASVKCQTRMWEATENWRHLPANKVQLTLEPQLFACNGVLFFFLTITTPVHTENPHPHVSDAMVTAETNATKKNRRNSTSWTVFVTKSQTFKLAQPQLWACDSTI